MVDEARGGAGWRAPLKGGGVAGALVVPAALLLLYLHLLLVLYGGAVPGFLLGAGGLLLAVVGLLAGLVAGGLAGLLLAHLPARLLPWRGPARGVPLGVGIGAVLVILEGSRAWGPLPLAPYLLGAGAAWGGLAGRLSDRWRGTRGRVFPFFVPAAAVVLVAAWTALPKTGGEPIPDALGPSPVVTATGDGGNDQMAYRTLRGADPPRLGAEPEMGAFPLLRLSTDSGEVVTRLDEAEWNSTPGYRAPDSPVVRTRSVHASLGIEVVQEDLVVPGRDVLLRRLQIARLPGSAVTGALLEYHANFNPTTRRIPYLPVADWALDRGLPEEVACDSDAGSGARTLKPEGGSVLSGSDAVLHTTRGMEVAVAWAVEPPALYRCVAGGDGRGVAEVALNLSGEPAEVVVAFALAADPQAARALLEEARERPFADHRDRAEAEARAWLAPAPMPNTTDPRVVEVARRALLSIRTAADRETGAIVASVSRQPPYYVDWPRDGVFINHALDRAGHPEMVEAHNRFYARTQRPSGTWAMALYTDGGEGAPLLFEIDETGLALWGMWDHYAFTRNRTYLEAVYPAISRGADFLTWWRDPLNGLQFHANEDDHPEWTQGLQGAAAVYAGLRAAVEAGREVGDDPARVERWERRAGELREAALRTFWNGRNFGGGHGPGAWLLWPARMLDSEDPRARTHAEHVWASVESRMNNNIPWGLYEGKAPPALAAVWADDPGKMERLRALVRWLAREVADPDTGHLGEVHLREPDGTWRNHVAMPHVWAQALFYLSALEAFGEAAR